MFYTYGEIKTRKHFYPSDAKELVKKGTVSILVVSGSLSEKTKEILKEGNITAYEKVNEDVVKRINNSLKEEIG